MTVLEYAWGRLLAELMMLGAGLALFTVVVAVGYLVIVVLERRQ